MHLSNIGSLARSVCRLAGIVALVIPAMAQYGGGSGGTATATGSGGGATAGYNFRSNYHVGFDKPEAWGMKYFASSTLLSGLQPPDTSEGRHFGSVNIALEADWMPQLDAGQMRIGFGGKAPEDLNKAPIFARPVIRVGLPGEFSVVVAAPPPFEVFGITPHLLAFGVERPLMRRGDWILSWRGYGQVGSVKGAFTCPHSVLGYATGSPQNPTECVAESADVATLRYAGSEFQFAYRIPKMRKLIPHVAAGGNFIDAAFQVRAQVSDGFDQTRLWTRGGTFSGTAGVSYLVTRHAAITVDAFYSPLWVQRSAAAPRTNDGLFNVRALLSYSFH